MSKRQSPVLHGMIHFDPCSINYCDVAIDFKNTCKTKLALSYLCHHCKKNLPSQAYLPKQDEKHVESRAIPIQPQNLFEKEIELLQPKLEPLS